jgi:hypothetical protein
METVQRIALYVLSGFVLAVVLYGLISDGLAIRW